MSRIEITINGNRWAGEPEAGETLMDFLRDRLHLTGTKCGCRTGNCGACKVLLDGKAVNSCTLLVKNLDGRSIVTIEGLAQGDNLHPVQHAFIETGAIQCGFCTPGMVVQSVALLQTNPRPSEEEIVAALGDNLCRCTGYVKIIQAIQRAAGLLQGDSSGQTAEGIGAAVPVIDAVSKVTGRLKYLNDLHMPGMVYGKILYSPHAHARIRSIDAGQALALPGVLAVATCFNTPQTKYNSALRFERHTIPADETIFAPVVRFVGDRVAAVAATTAKIAAQALALIKVDYELLPAVFDPEEALQPEAPEIKPGGNLVGEIKAEAGNPEEGLAASDLVFTDKFYTPRPSPLALEPHACIASYESDGQLTVWSTTQNIFGYRVILSEIFSLPQHKVRVIKPPVGGAFGGKLEMTIEPVAAALSQFCRRPVKIELTRAETFFATRTRHATVVEIKTGVRKDGTLLAQDIKVIANTGAYTSSAFNVIGAMSDKAFKQYRIPNLRYSGLPVVTNTPVAGAMRGYGSPQLVLAREVHLDRIARALKLDPVELRRRNLVRPGDVNPRNGESLGNCRPLDCLELAAKQFGWEEWQAPSLPAHKKRGIGVAVGLHGNGVYPAHADITTVTMKLNEDGTGIIYTGSQDLGQGLTTIILQIASDTLGMRLEDWSLIDADTALVPWDLGTYASRGTWVGGQAVRGCAEIIAERLKAKAGQLLNIAPEELSLSEGQIKGPSGESLRLRDVVWKMQQEDGQELIASYTQNSLFNPVSYGANFAEVEVDTEQKTVKVLRMAVAYDVGKAINPLMVEGQIEGGVQMGIGYALSEDVKLDETGRVSNASLKKYKTPKAVDMPKLDVMIVDNVEQHGKLGGKSIGECATVPVAPAIVNAVVHALGKDIDIFPIDLNVVLGQGE
ncbi:molybdopterin-dependent oxidoreductase [Paradesulfitobacterium ferrireducens]|uniref:molybdopterin-dependent oxidoreductase n=1 Tax=Paradesulfitobacterium ferrireducens TaxID=2816476 RepID=UPI001A8DEF03|nr:molybdopterin cofactor-binding domain-containing protein [Paradesulfitobacterium ferrireducens]